MESQATRDSSDAAVSRSRIQKRHQTMRRKERAAKGAQDDEELDCCALRPERLLIVLSSSLQSVQACLAGPQASLKVRPLHLHLSRQRAAWKTACQRGRRLRPQRHGATCVQGTAGHWELERFRLPLCPRLPAWTWKIWRRRPRAKQAPPLAPPPHSVGALGALGRP